MAVVVLMLAIFTYEVWRIFHDNVLSDWKEPESYLGNLIWIIRSLVLPLAAAMGVYLLRPWGVQSVSIWLLFSMSALEMNLLFYGPSFSFPRAWLTISLVLVFLFLIGGGDIWCSLVVRSLDKKMTAPAWFNKLFWVLIVSLLLGLPPSSFIYNGMKKGFSSPEFLIRPNIDKIEITGNSPNLPFAYQVDLPSSPKNCWVYPKEGYMNVGLGECSDWTLDSKNGVDDGLSALTKSKEKFLRERYGLLPRVIRNDFGLKPDFYFEIKQNGLWGSVSVKKLEKTGKAVVQVYLWDDAGTPLGAITGVAASIAPQDWKWVYSIRKSEPPLWSAEKYEETARFCMAAGQADTAEFYLASAVLVDKDKVPRLKSLIEYYRKQGLTDKAKYQLKVALDAFPQDPILKTIQLTKVRGK